MRKSIFEIASEKIDLASEANRIVEMSTKEEVLCVAFNYYTLTDYIDAFCFRDWTHRGHFLNVKDFLRAIDYPKIVNSAQNDYESLLTLIELVYNFWNLASQQLDEQIRPVEWTGNFYHLQDVMEDILSQYNHKAYYIDDEKILVIEDKPEVSAAVEIVGEGIASDIIRYNHHSLEGDIVAKKAILLKLGSELEPKRKKLQAVNNQLSEDIFFMLNNINVRHNNRDKNDSSKYKETVASMTDDQLEEWYDELYQMILLAFLLLDNEERKPKVKALKESIVGG